MLAKMGEDYSSKLRMQITPLLNQPKYTPVFRSADWHLTTKCNYKCKFCFAKHLDKEICDLNLIKKCLRHLTLIGIEKINFVGGEPLLHPFFLDTIKTAKDMGFVVCVLSNGYFLNKNLFNKLSSYVDWIGFSVDSAFEAVEVSLGRGNGNHVKHIIELSEIVHKAGVKLKINTTVTKLNWAEDMRPLIQILKPERWKVFQVLHIKGQNDRHFNELSVTDMEFSYFKSINQECPWRTKAVFETNKDMIGSYFMLSPGGMVFNNQDGSNYSLTSLEDVKKRNIAKFFDVKKYVERGGIYPW